MTNLVAIVGTTVVTFATNWVTVSKTIPVVRPGAEFQAVWTVPKLNQTGTVFKQVWFDATWKGKPTRLLLEDVMTGETLSRSIDDPSFKGGNITFP